LSDGTCDHKNDGNDSAQQRLVRKFNERWPVEGGWRYVSIEKKIEGRDVETDFSGPLPGLTARF
jgi:hypothetical protein